ncbi:hypothetical protein SUGI_0277500 [Cryptomeria japonica]|uniref:regulator of G-protein signaling 1 isoform X2 n=1 Tax=Cryptomeria japonica TaxID=3369 RepID=UPI002408A040|nr:regulator of G-protein signaling 1 isoform X2 [Cryptomeria japonica]GLJ16370.1 hypothetical protein SUGI_0277500 [Cryptomeria japonica]
MVKMIPNHVYGEGKVASPTDYVAVGISALTIFILLCGTFFAHLIHGVPEIKKKQVQLFVLQTIASIIFLLSLVISLNLIKSKHRHIWHSCYLWTVWLGGPCGFGLLMSCRIAQAHRLYYLFVKRRLPPIKPYQLVPLILIPWVGIAALVQAKRPFNIYCHLGNQWVISWALLHHFYLFVLVGITWKIRHIEFQFDEFKELVKGVTVTLIFLGVWIAIYVANEVHHEKTASLMVASRFTLMLTANVMVLSFFFMSMSRPLFNQLSMRKRESDKFETMGQVLGIPDSGLLFPTGLPLNLDEPIEKLLEQKKFRHSFMAFADSRMAGESVHFYDEVHELNKIPITDTARRIYLSGHIIEQHISVGSPMEINISHQMRQEVLNTTDLAHPDLFKHAINEMVQLMRMNLEKDYWSSPFYLQFKEEIKAEVEVSEPLENITSWNCSPKVSSVNAVDDPFHQDSLTKNSEAQYQFSLQINKDSAEETSSQSSQTNFLSSSRCSFANFSSNKRGWS